jgi:hypothetical protein
MVSSGLGVVMDRRIRTRFHDTTGQVMFSYALVSEEGTSTKEDVPTGASCHRWTLADESDVTPLRDSARLKPSESTCRASGLFEPCDVVLCALA